MPFLTVNTNAKLAPEEVDALLSAGAELIASELHKPVSYVVVNYNGGASMSFGGNPQTIGVLAEMKSIGFGDKRSLAKLLTEFLYDRLHADLNNINIQFVDMPGADVAIGGRTFG